MKTLVSTFILSFLLLQSTNSIAHCEIPCGIYDDELRIKLLYEHVTTIEKSMTTIISLEKESPVNNNQLIRWVDNKELHANKIQEIVSQYFLTQRIKSGQKQYNEKLAALHQILVYAMKAKQTTDLENITKLRSFIAEFEDMYLEHSHD